MLCNSESFVHCNQKSIDTIMYPFSRHHVYKALNVVPCPFPVMPSKYTKKWRASKCIKVVKSSVNCWKLGYVVKFVRRCYAVSFLTYDCIRKQEMFELVSQKLRPVVLALVVCVPRNVLINCLNSGIPPYFQGQARLISRTFDKVFARLRIVSGA